MLGFRAQLPGPPAHDPGDHAGRPTATSRAGRIEAASFLCPATPSLARLGLRLAHSGLPWVRAPVDEVRTELVGVGLRRESWVSSAGPAAPPLPASEPGASAAPAPGGRSSRKAQEGEEGRTPRPAQGGLPGSRGVGAVSRRPLRRLRPRREGTGRARDPACPRAKEEPEDGGSRDKKGQGAGDRARQEGGHLAEAQKRDGIGGRAGSEGTPSPTLPASAARGCCGGPRRRQLLHQLHGGLGSRHGPRWAGRDYGRGGPSEGGPDAC